jgi:xanthine dehydrogenase accessory factor
VKELINAWPDEAFKQVSINTSTAVVTLTHDPKIDDPALITALGSPAFYIGALGSKTTHKKRLGRLMGAGKKEEDLARIHAPVGLDLGGRMPEEIALAIMAEIIQVWNQ